MKPLEVNHFAEQDILEVEGIKYAGVIFRSLGIGPIGSTFSICKRDDGILTLQSHARTPREERAVAFEEAALDCRSRNLTSLALKLEAKAALARRS